MKYTIEGFSQERAVELGLNAEDLVILRWFVDFFNSDKMTKMVYEDKVYAWVSYSHFMKQMPIISCNKRTIAKKFQRLVDAEVLTNQTIRQGGSFSVYGFGKAYTSLVSKNAPSAPKTAEGLHENEQGGCTKNDNQRLVHQKMLPSDDDSNTPKAPRGGARAKEITELFCSICTGLPKPKTMPDSRRKAILAADKEITEAGGWEQFFQLVADNSFLNGDNDRHWVASFDWILKPANRVKIIEGNYKSREEKPVEKDYSEEWWNEQT